MQISSGEYIAQIEMTVHQLDLHPISALSIYSGLQRNVWSRNHRKKHLVAANPGQVRKRVAVSSTKRSTFENRLLGGHVRLASSLPIA